jgi:hypothetical protein
LVTISSPAIDPAISILPVKNQLIANVSSVPNVRQLRALRTDLVCVSAPRNKTTRRPSPTFDQNLTRDALATCHPPWMGKSSIDPARDYVHSDWKYFLKLLDLTNQLPSIPVSPLFVIRLNRPQKGLK